PHDRTATPCSRFVVAPSGARTDSRSALLGRLPTAALSRRAERGAVPGDPTCRSCPRLGRARIRRAAPAPKGGVGGRWGRASVRDGAHDVERLPLRAAPAEVELSRSGGAPPRLACGVIAQPGQAPLNESLAS